MGKRSRKRGVSTSVEERPSASAPPRPAPTRRGSYIDRTLAKAEQRPKAPWDPFPLVELCVLAGIALIVLGIINSDTRDGKVMLAFGLTLASLAGLDTAAREHFGGFRSHSTLLAGIPAVVGAALMFFLRAPVILIPVTGVLVLAAAFFFFRAQFRKRSGGLSFKV
jgi:hypothetical protein